MLTLVGVTWLITQGRQIRPWVLETLRRRQVRKGRKVGSQQPSMYIHPLPSLSTQFFICSSSSLWQKTLFLCRKVQATLMLTFNFIMFKQINGYIEQYNIS